MPIDRADLNREARRTGNIPHVCDVCGVRPETPLSCSACKATVYCGTECQRKDWRAHKKSCRAISDAVVDARPNTLELAFNLLATNPVLQDYIMLLASSAIDIPANPNAFQTQYVIMDWSLKKRRGLPDTVHITGLSTYAIADGPELILEAVRNQRANRGDPTFYMLYQAQGPHGPFVQLPMNDPLPVSMIRAHFANSQDSARQRTAKLLKIEQDIVDEQQSQ